MKESDTKGYTMYDFIYMTFWKSQNYRNKNQISGCQGLDVEERGKSLKRSKRKLFRMMEMFYISTGVMII